MKYDIESLMPIFLKKTNQESELEAFIRCQLVFVLQIYNELVDFLSSLDLKDLEDVRNIKSKYIAMWLSDLFGIVHTTTQTTQMLADNLYYVFYAFKHIGTEESLILLFKVFLNVDVEITTPEAGVVQIKMLGNIKTNVFRFIAPSTRFGYPFMQGGKIIDTPASCIAPAVSSIKRRFTKIIANIKQTDGTIKKKALILTMFPEGYEHAFYSFLKRFIPIGRVLKVISKDGSAVEELHL